MLITGVEVHSRQHVSIRRSHCPLSEEYENGAASDKTCSTVIIPALEMTSVVKNTHTLDKLRIYTSLSMPPLKPSHTLKKLPHHLRSSTYHHRRQSSTNFTNSNIPEVARISTRRLISLHGRDAPHFLQGLTTQNIPSSATTTGFYSAFLNASGRVLHDVFIYPAAHSETYQNTVLGEKHKGDPGLIIEVDANEVDALARHLKRFKLRAKVDIRVLEEAEWGVWQAWVDWEELRAYNIGCCDERAPYLGYRVISPEDMKPCGSKKVSVKEYEVRRMLAGVAEGQGEILKETALPQESNMDYMGGIDFRKGCYVGQELTIRTHHTGVVRKRILPVQIYDPGEKPPDILTYNEDVEIVLPPRGANISRVDKKGRSAGKWLGGVGNIGLALCRLEVMTDTVLTGEGSQWSPEHEFKVAWEPQEGMEGGEVKIKAFVPSWHKIRADQQKLHRN